MPPSFGSAWGGTGGAIFRLEPANVNAPSAGRRRFAKAKCGDEVRRRCANVKSCANILGRQRNAPRVCGDNGCGLYLFTLRYEGQPAANKEVA